LFSTKRKLSQATAKLLTQNTIQIRRLKINWKLFINIHQYIKEISKFKNLQFFLFQFVVSPTFGAGFIFEEPVSFFFFSY
jgi:hypothetical protein